MPDDFTTIWEPFQMKDVMLIHGVLSGTGIRYFIVNENYSQMGGGVGIGDTRMELRVESARAQEALRLVQQMIGPRPAQPDA